MDTPIPPIDRSEYERQIAAMRAATDESTFHAAWEERRNMKPEEFLVKAGQIRNVSSFGPETQICFVRP